MKRGSKALDERMTGDWYFYSSLITQHFQVRRMQYRGANPNQLQSTKIKDLVGTQTRDSLRLPRR